jgi:hypothetical protein
MAVFQETRDHAIGKDMGPPELGHVLIQAHEIGKTTAKDKSVGVQNVNDLSERTRQTLFVTV